MNCLFTKSLTSISFAESTIAFLQPCNCKHLDRANCLSVLFVLLLVVPVPVLAFALLMRKLAQTEIVIQLPATQGIFSKILAKMYKVYHSQFLLLHKHFYSFRISIIYFTFYIFMYIIFMLKLKNIWMIFNFYHYVSFTVLFACIFLCNHSVCGFPFISICQHFSTFDFTSTSHSLAQNSWPYKQSCRDGTTDLPCHWVNDEQK